MSNGGRTGNRGLWSVLNSQFTLWLLGSVVLSGITYYWNHRNDARLAEQKDREAQIAKQREDSQFLATLLSYLTNPDRAVRLRAIDVIRARYAEDEIPPTIQRLIANTIEEESLVPSSQQKEETRRLIANAARVLDRLPEPDPSVVTTLRQLPTRVYMHISSERQRQKAGQIHEKLTQQGFIVPGIENVAGKADPPDRTQIRFFYDSDVPSVDRVARILAQNGISAVDPVRLEPQRDKVRPGTVEIWFAR